MSVKQWVATGVAVCAFGSAMAGGIETAPVVHQPDQSGFYVGVNGGYYMRNMEDVNTVPFGGGSLVTITKKKNIKGGLTAGGLLGYRFDSNFSLEAGGNWLADTKYTASGGVLRRNSVSHYRHSITNNTAAYDYVYKTWIAYAAAKGSVSVYDNMNVYVKAGVAYTHYKITRNTTEVDKDVFNAWGPMLAFGAEYMVNDQLSVAAQYMMVPRSGDRKKQDDAVMAGKFIDVAEMTHLFTIGVNYYF